MPCYTAAGGLGDFAHRRASLLSRPVLRPNQSGRAPATVQRPRIRALGGAKSPSPPAEKPHWSRGVCRRPPRPPSSSDVPIVLPSVP